MFLDRPIFEQRWIPWVNRSGQPVPAYGLLKVSDFADIDDDAMIVFVGQSGSQSGDTETDEGTAVYLVNGPQRVDPSRKGICTADAPMQALVAYSETAPTLGDSLGPNADFSTALSPDAEGTTHTFISFEACPNLNFPSQSGLTMRVAWVTPAAAAAGEVEVVEVNANLEAWTNGEEFEHGCETLSGEIVDDPCETPELPADAKTVDVKFIRRKGREPELSSGDRIQCMPLDLTKSPPQYLAIGEYLKGGTSQFVLVAPAVSGNPSEWGRVAVPPAKRRGTSNFYLIPGVGAGNIMTPFYDESAEEWQFFRSTETVQIYNYSDEPVLTGQGGSGSRVYMLTGRKISNDIVVVDPSERESHRFGTTRWQKEASPVSGSWDDPWDVTRPSTNPGGGNLDDISHQWYMGWKITTISDVDWIEFTRSGWRMINFEFQIQRDVEVLDTVLDFSNWYFKLQTETVGSVTKLGPPYHSLFFPPLKAVTYVGSTIGTISQIISGESGVAVGNKFGTVSGSMLISAAKGSRFRFYNSSFAPSSGASFTGDFNVGGDGYVHISSPIDKWNPGWDASGDPWEDSEG